MICFFGNPSKRIFALQTQLPLDAKNIKKLSWLFGDQPHLDTPTVEGVFVGPRVSMVTPWSTNAVEITQNMGIKGIVRIEEFKRSQVWRSPLEEVPYTTEPNLVKKVGKILAKEMFVDYSDLQRGEEVKLDPFQKWIVPVVKIWIHELRNEAVNNASERL